MKKTIFFTLLAIFSLTAVPTFATKSSSNATTTTETRSKLSEEERLAVNISQSLIRCSIGLEDVEDIYTDIAQAIDKSK